MSKQSPNLSGEPQSLFSRVFIRTANILLRRPKSVLFVVFLVMLVLMSALPRITVDTSAEGFLYEDAEPILRYDVFRDEFGRDEFFVVAITGVDVFDLDFLAKLSDLHQTLEQRLSKLESVESLVNVRSIYGDGDELVAEDLLETLPVNDDELAVLKQRIRSTPAYYDRLINRDETAVTLIVKLVSRIQVGTVDGKAVFENLTEADLYASCDELTEIIEEVKGDFVGANVQMGGTQAVGSYMNTVLQKDFVQFTVVALLMVMMFLWALFRRLSAVFIAISVMVISIISCFSLMVWLGFPMQITSSILPSFLLAVCVGDSVHLLSIFYHYFDKGDSKEKAILHAVEHAGIAVLFTSLTTAAGLLTFAVSDIRPVAGLGLFAAMGSLIAFISTLVLVPVLLQLSKVKRKGTEQGTGDTHHYDSTKMDEGSLVYKFTKACIRLSTSYPKSVVGVAVALMIATMTIVPNIRFAQDSLAWLADDVPIKVAIKTIDKEITGSLPFEIVIDTGEPQGALNPDFLQALDRWVEDIKTEELNGIKVVTAGGLTTLIKETHKAMNGNDAAFYTVPDQQDLIAQELLLVEMDQADDLFQFTDKRFQKTRVTIIMPWVDAVRLSAMEDELVQHYNRSMGDLAQQYPIEITGLIPVFSTMFTAMVNSAAQSYLLAFAVICLMMMVLLRSFVDGFISMLPNLLPIMLVLSYMTIVDIPLDVFNVLIGSIALGLCVDDTVHFMHGFKVAYARSNDTLQAIEDTLLSTGKAMLITTVVLCCGFLTYTLSELKNMQLFGQLTAVCIFMALFADFLIAPALMVLRYGKKDSN